jgi:hypothetical protein
VTCGRGHARPAAVADAGPQGAEALSDPVSLAVPALTDLAVSVYIPQATEQTGHNDSQESTYITEGTDHAGDTTAAAYFPISSWWFVDSVDVTASRPDEGTVVALGDSITDGYQSTVNADKRWPNDLARRLDARRGVTLSVADEGISGNEVWLAPCHAGLNDVAHQDRADLFPADPGAVDRSADGRPAERHRRQGGQPSEQPSDRRPGSRHQHRFRHDFSSIERIGTFTSR